MPIDPTIPLSGQAPTFDTALKPISTFLGIQNQQQQLNNSRLSYEANAANLKELNAARALANDPSVQNPDGSINQEKFTAKVQRVAPTLGAGIAQGNLVNQGTQTANASNQFRLHNDYADVALRTASGLLQDPRIAAAPDQYNDQEAAKALTEGFNQMLQKGVPQDQALLAVAPFMMNVHQPGAVRQMLANTVNGNLSAQGQAGQSLVPAGGQQAVSTDANGNPTVVQRDQFGNVTNVKSAPVQGQSEAKPFTIPSGETPQSVADLQQKRGAINQAASTVPDQHYNNRQIISILDKEGENGINATGSNAPFLSHYLGGVGLSTDFATNAQKISHFLALQTQANEKAMGVHSDAGQALAESASGSIKQTPESLRTAVSVNDAASTGIDFFNRGMEAAVQKNGIGSVRAFQNAWSQNYDVNAMRLYNAQKNGDKKEAAEVIQDLGGKDSPQFKSMIKKAHNLELLSTQGYL